MEYSVLLEATQYVKVNNNYVADHNLYIADNFSSISELSKRLLVTRFLFERTTLKFTKLYKQLQYYLTNPFRRAVNCNIHGFR